MAFEYKQEYNIYIVIAIGIIFFIIVSAVMISRQSRAYAASKETATTVRLDDKIYSINPMGGCKPKGVCALRDYYIKGSYNTCVEGPYNGGSVSITYLKNAIAQGYRFLDFEIYASGTSDPIVSCSTNETQCGTDATTFYSIPFSDVMDTIDTYAFTNSGCNNFKDPLLVNLRIKTCDVNVVSKLADIFKKHSRKMLGSAYSYNKNNSNFGDAPLSKLMGKVCLFVDSKSLDYSSNSQFMEYVNSSTITGFVKEMTQSAFKNIPSLDELIEYNKRNMTIILPDYANPQNSVLQAYQNAGCQVVAMMPHKKDSYVNVQDSYFSTQYHSAFVLKPEKYRYIPETIPAPTPQAPANSYASRPLDTGVAGIKFDI